MRPQFSYAEIPKVERWTRVVHDDSVWSFLSAEGGAELAVAFSALYWPAFIEVEGCVLLLEKYKPSSFKDWWERLNGNKSAIEEVINHVHLWDLFGETELPEGALEHLGYVLRSCWECALLQAFPGRRFHVQLALDEEDYGPTLYVSTVR